MKNKRSYLINLLFGVICFFLLTAFTEGRFSSIESAFINQEHDAVVRYAEDFLKGKTDPRSKNKVMYYEGVSYLRLGQYGKARQILQKAANITKSPELRDRACLGIADTYYLEENYPDAVKELDRIISSKDASDFLSIAYLKNAKANLKLAHWEKARDYLRRIIVDYPDSFDVYSAKQLLNEEQYFTVQVGAFMDKEKAKGLLLELKKKNEYAFIVETKDRNNRKFYRVRVGRVALLDQARELKVKLSQEGYPAKIYP